MDCRKQEGNGEGTKDLFAVVYPNTLAEAEEHINALTNYEKMDMRNIRYDTTEFDMKAFATWLRMLGSPQDSADVVFHVVGTKGKGSTCAMLSAALRAMEARVGRYTSPHLFRLTERITVDDEEIPEDVFCRMTGDLEVHLRTNVSHGDKLGVGMRSAFELLTAMAYYYFRMCHCRAAVVEAGLGGRLDATNVFRSHSQKLINLIMPIGLEHTSVLGDTIEAIAAEKAAVIQSHTSAVIVASQQPEFCQAVSDAVVARVKAVGCRGNVIVLDNCPPPRLVDASQNRWSFAVQDETVEAVCPLVGTRQAWNMFAALTAIGEGYGLAGLKHAVALPWNVTWHGRFEILRQTPPVVIDGAHCPLSARGLFETWADRFGADCVPIVVCGFMADKNVAGIFKVMQEALTVQEVHLCSSVNSRALPPTEVQVALMQNVPSDVKSVIHATVADAVRVAVHTGKPVLVFGSLGLIRPTLEVWSEICSAGGAS